MILNQVNHVTFMFKSDSSAFKMAALGENIDINQFHGDPTHTNYSATAGTT